MTKSFTISLLLLLSGSSFAQVYKTWDGEGGGSSWNTAANWSPDGIPLAADFVALDTAATATLAITVDAAAVCENLTLGHVNGSMGTVTLTIATGITLAVGGDLTMDSLNDAAFTITLSGTAILTVGDDIIFDFGSNNKTQTINVDAGTLSVADIITHTSTGGNSTINVTTGTVNFDKTTAWSWPNETDLNVTGTPTGTGVVFDAGLTMPADDANFTISGTSAILTITGALDMGSALNTIIISGSGATFTVTGAVTHDAGDISLQNNGSLTFGGLVTSTVGTIENTTTAGTINFNVGYTKNGGTWTTMAGETINFGGNYINTTAASTFNATSNVFFTGTGGVTPSTNITFGNVQVNTGVTTTFNTAAGVIAIAGNLTLAGSGALNENEASGVTITGNVTLGATSVLTLNSSALTVGGNWTDNGTDDGSLAQELCSNGIYQLSTKTEKQK